MPFRHWLFVFLCLVSSAVFAEAEPQGVQVDLERFARLPVMHEGRVKPVESFAQALLKAFSGSSENATDWLAETLFNPARGESLRVLRVTNPAVLNMLQIERHPSRRYSYREITDALAGKQDVLFSILESPDDDWTVAQRDFVRLQQRAVQLGDLLASLSLFLPLSHTLPPDVPGALQPYAVQPLTYQDTLKFTEILQAETAAIVRKKGDNLSSYTGAEQALTILSFTLANLRSNGQRSEVFRVIPKTNDPSWQSPWQILKGAGGPETVKLMNAWSGLSKAYHQNDPAAWEQHLEVIETLTQTLGGASYRELALTVEYIYHWIAPFSLSAWFFSAALGLMMAGSILKQNLSAPAVICLMVAVLLYSGGLGARMYILERPPVSTLYESVIFVALFTALYGLLFFWRTREDLWLYVGAGGGLFLTLVSFTHDQEGDSFLMLTAVLNTNFWLATHVICMMLGYALCLITSILAHIYLLRPERDMFKHLHTAALAALLFSAVGTVLGGIWADQSWGRFWGWDPKENGALLIVLWIVWLLHGRISGQMKEVFVTAGLAYLSVIVALSWFGVNLLNVGLHAYGFTDMAAWSLGVFILVETALIAALLYARRRGVAHAV